MHLAEDPPNIRHYDYELSDHHVLNRSTLLNAALCCKTFLEPALDTLWWSIDNIAHLFLLLPAFRKNGPTYVKLTPSIIYQIIL